MRLGGLVFLYVLIADSVDAWQEENCSVSAFTTCPLYNVKSDIVTPALIASQNVTGIRWILIYYTQFHPHQLSGKCIFRWHNPDSDNLVRREIMCYNIHTKTCFGSEFRLKQKLDSCGRLEENSGTSDQRTMDAKFYSRDLSQYFWYKACYNYTASGDCEIGFMNLLVRGTRDAGYELNLQGLPWHLINADLTNNLNMSISDENMTFSWEGPECGFDGYMRTTSASQRARNYFALLILLVFTPSL